MVSFGWLGCPRDLMAAISWGVGVVVMWLGACLGHLDVPDSWPPAPGLWRASFPRPHAVLLALRGAVAVLVGALLV